MGSLPCETKGPGNSGDLALPKSGILHVCGKLNSPGVFIQLYHSCIGNFCRTNSGTSSIDFMGQEGRK